MTLTTFDALDYFNKLTIRLGGMIIGSVATLAILIKIL